MATNPMAVVQSENARLKTENHQLNDELRNLRDIFTVAEKWSDVNPAWPDAEIERFIPGADSGTLDFFAETTFTRKLEDLPKDTLVAILEANLSTGLIRRYESEKPFAERTREEIYNLVLERVVERRVVKSWSLTESLFNRGEIEAFVESIPQGELEFRSWLHLGFLTRYSTPVTNSRSL